MTISQGSYDFAWSLKKGFASHLYVFDDIHEQNEDQNKALHALENIRRNVQKYAIDDNKRGTQNNCKKSYGFHYHSSDYHNGSHLALRFMKLIQSRIEAL